MKRTGGTGETVINGINPSDEPTPILTDTIGNIAVTFVDENGDTYGVKQVDGKPRVSSMSYMYDIAENNIANHMVFTKAGYNNDVGATEEDIIASGGTYPVIAAGGY